MQINRFIYTLQFIEIMFKQIPLINENLNLVHLRSLNTEIIELKLIGQKDLNMPWTQLSMILTKREQWTDSGPKSSDFCISVLRSEFVRRIQSPNNINIDIQRLQPRSTITRIVTNYKIQ